MLLLMLVLAKTHVVWCQAHSGKNQQRGAGFNRCHKAEAAAGWDGIVARRVTTTCDH